MGIHTTLAQGLQHALAGHQRDFALSRGAAHEHSDLAKIYI
jgi:hypothetical protein